MLSVKSLDFNSFFNYYPRCCCFPFLLVQFVILTVIFSFVLDMELVGLYVYHQYNQYFDSQSAILIQPASNPWSSLTSLAIGEIVFCLFVLGLIFVINLGLCRLPRRTILSLPNVAISTVQLPASRQRRGEHIGVGSNSSTSNTHESDSHARQTQLRYIYQEIRKSFRWPFRLVQILLGRLDFMDLGEMILYRQYEISLNWN